jgi:OCT family organic cation transporter-like MFS transporter 18
MLCVHLNITLYALTYWITRPVQPFLFKNLGADAVIFGYLQTTFSVVQLAGSPIIGRLCDTQGSKLALQMCQIATGLSYILLGTAYNIPLLFLAQLPTVLMQSMHCAQAFVSEFSSEESRSNALGRLSLSYGVGMAAGPLLGGYLSDLIGVQNVAICAGLLMFLPVYFNAVLLPRRVAAGEKGAAGGAGGGLRLAEIGRVLENRTCRQLTVFMLLTGLAGQVYHSPPPLPPVQSGYVSSISPY